MFISKKHLPRRTFLRGVGVTLALPLLDSMVPAQTLLSKTAAKAPPRLGFVYIPHGAIMDKWTPATEGKGFEFTPILKPLEPYQDYVNVVSGLGHRAADSTAVHSLSPTTWLSGVRPKPTQGVDAFAGVTADQIAAQHMGQDTMLPSLELATEDHSGLIGACDRDYGCIYMNTLSWRTPTTPQPMEINPRKVFERMFGQGGSIADRTQHTQEERSILDAITQQASDLQRSLGPQDRSTLSDYLDERARDRAPDSEGRRRAGQHGSSGISGGHSLQFRAAHQPDVRSAGAGLPRQRNARGVTFMVAREVSNRTYPQIGVPDGHHATSHHQNKPEKIEKLVKIQTLSFDAVRAVPGQAEDDAGRRRHAAGSFAPAIRQQHEQQQRA